MKISIASDLHLDIWRMRYQDEKVMSYFKSKLDREVLILAGDIGEFKCFREHYFLKFFNLISDMFKEVILIKGNHELYRNYWNLDENIREFYSNWSNFHYLEKDVFSYEGKTFIGTTLWSDMSNTSKQDQESIELFGLNDYRYIHKGHNKKIKCKDTHSEFLKSCEFLKESILPGSIVITHHLPSFLSINKQFENDPLNVCYASSLDDLILEKKPAYWVSGHTHLPVDYILGETRMLGNPLGYPGELLKWDLIEIDI